MKRRKFRRKLITTVALALLLVSSVKALSHEGTCGRLVKFIDFYIASQQAEAPSMSLWERVIYSIALAKTPEKAPIAFACPE